MLPIECNAVVHVSSVHPWTDNRIHYRECVSLAENGFDVTLIAVESSVDAPQTQVKLLLLPIRPRTRRMVISSIQAIALALKTRAPLVHLHDPELIPYIILLRAAGRKVIYDAHEHLPDQLLNKPYIPQRAIPIIRAFSRSVLKIAKMSNLVICATDKVAEPFKTRPHSVIRNYPRLRAAEDGDRQLHILDRPNSVVYVGAISENRGAQVMVDSIASELFPKNWRLQLAGKSSDTLRRALETSSGWSRVDYHDILSPDMARELLLRAKIGLVILADNDAYRVSLPTKMFEYFAAGLPVIASDFPLWRQILVERECGLVVSPDAPGEVSAAIRRYAEDPELLEAHSRNARRLAIEEFNWNSEGEELVRSYGRLFNTRGVL